MRAGHLFEISSGNRHAVVTEQGATLAKVRWDGAELLARPAGDADDCYASSGSYGQLLVPWPGRVAKGTYQYEGETYRLPLNDHAGLNAIHGWARWAPWQPQEHLADRLTMTYRLLALPGYPFTLDLEQSYAWQSDHLEISFTARNTGNRTAPFGYGCHPYFSVGSETVDHDLLHIPASGYLEVEGQYPTGKVLPVEGTSFDFREPRPIGQERLDVTLADLIPDDQGQVVVQFRSATGGASVTLRYDEPIRFVQVYTGDTLPSGQRTGVAVEPYTCAPDAFNNGMGLAHLAPGASMRAHWTLST
jgi:aldose 1-epimerase